MRLVLAGSTRLRLFDLVILDRDEAASAPAVGLSIDDSALDSLTESEARMTKVKSLILDRSAPNLVQSAIKRDAHQAILIDHQLQ